MITLQSIKLNNIIDFNPKVKLEKSDPYSFIPMENITPDMKFVSDVEKKEWQGQSSSKFENGDILFARIYPCLDNRKIAVAKIDGKGFGSTEFFVLRAKEGIADQNFVYYLSKSDLIVQTAINSYVGASGRQRADLKFIKNSHFDLPSYDNQRKIAAMLSTYDDLIDTNRKQIVLLENMAEELYKEWFVRFRFPNWENTEFEKGIPTDWREVSLGSICKVVMGQSPKSEYYNENGVGLPFHQGVGTYGERFPISRTYCSIAGRTAYENDILFSVRAPVGRLNIANTKMIIGRGLSAFSSLEGYSDYLYYLLHYSFEREDIIGNGAIFNSVTKDELLGFKILYPSESILKRFNNLAKDFNTMIKALYDKNENLSLQKNSLLPRLMSGRLSVADLDIHYPPSMQTSEEAEEK